MPQPPVISIKVTYPGSLLNPSFVDITLLSSSAFGLGVFDAWCADRDISLDLSSQGGGNYASGTLLASVYSTYELGILGAAIPTIETPGNLDLVNWLLNQNFNINGYTMGEVQGAVWLLLGDDYASSTIISPRDPAKITQLVNLANQHDGYVPDITDSDPTNDKVAVMLFPHKADGTAQQPLLIQVQSAALGDRVWSDSDGNGAQDAGETGVQGVTVNLWRDLNDNSIVDANEVLASTITDASGNYKFVGLTPGLQYQLQFMQPSGYSGFTLKDASGDTVDSDVDSYGITAAITLAPGEFNTSIDAGLVQRAHIGDRLWEDTNANGQQDAGEAGIAGVVVELKDANGAVIASTTTDANGVYGFNVLPGTYSVSVTPPAGYVITPANQGNDGSDSDIDGAGQTGQYTLASGETNNSVDGGLYRTAELGDRVWLDTDGDGQQDAGEAGVQNVTVQLKDGNGNVVASQQTDANGNYLFTNLTPGTYSVAFVAPVGYEFTQANLGADASDSDANTVTGETAQTVLDSNESDRTWDAGLVQRAHIGDRLWEDTNANGQQDAGEAGIANVVVELKDANGAVIASTSTDANGVYGFNVLPGTYSVSVTPPAGYVITPANQGNDGSDSDIDGAGQTGQYTLASGETNNSVDGGLYRTAELGDRVWLDTDGDGQQDAGEAGVQNVTVNLKDGNGNVVASQQTDANGNYLFTNLVPGTYSVAFVAPVGYEFTQANLGADASDSDANTVTGETAQTVLDSNESDRTWDAGLVQRAHIGDTIWEDTNANGQQDSGEAGIANVVVELKDANGAVIASTSTDANGVYGFNVLPGTYSVSVTPPAGYVITPANQGNDGSDSDIDGAGQTGQYTLASGETNNSVDGGLYRTAELGDRVWLDTDGDGQQDAGEAGVQNVTVNLKDGNGNVVASQQTDANGNYLFTNLVPGTYSVAFVAPVGYEFTQANLGADASDSDANTVTGETAQTVLDSNESDRTWDAGLVQRAHIGDTIWEDTNANGQQDAGEAGIANVVVELKDANGAVIASTSTDANGVYGFNVLPGTYSVSVTPPAGYVITPANQGNDGSDSDIDGAGQTGQYTLASGETNNSVDGGLYRTAELGDRVWLDTDGDGQQDAGEAGVQNVTVNLKDGNGNVVASQQTDANGNYLFTNLVPGTYSVAFVAPVGYEFTQANLGADASDSDANTVTGETAQTVLDSNESDRTWDAGLVQRASLGDRLWVDTNANGLQDDGSTGIAGATVTLIGGGADGVIGTGGDDTLATTITGADGYYNFAGLNIGEEYQVQFAAPAGMVFTGQNIGDDSSDSDVDTLTGKTQIVTLASGEHNPTLDAGVYALAAIGDRVWFDANANGVQDSGEAGIAGVTVNLMNAAGTTVLNTMTTDANGNYLFSNLTPGDYAVQVVAPVGYFVSSKDAGSNDAADSDIDPVTGKTIATTLDSGETDPTWDAGLYQKASIGDRVWLDNNANGVQDAGEAGINGVTVNLLNAAGAVIGTATTDANGNYLFNNLMPGDYAIQVVAPAGYTITGQDQGGNDATDSDINALTGKTVNTTLVAGENDLSWDAGLYQKAAIGDKVWFDLDKDGVQDAGEAGVQGVLAKLYDASGNVVATQSTNAGGEYLFTALTPGDYRVGFDLSTLPSGYSVTTQNAAGSTDANDSDAHVTTGLTALTNLESGETDRTWDMGISADVGIDIEKYVRGRYIDQTGGGEGLTPGFWKTHSAYGPAPLSGWPETGYSPDAGYEAIFGVSVAGTPTLLDALGMNGGGAEALMRHSAAALLNAANPNVDYQYSLSQVIAMTQAAFTSGNYETTKDLFAVQNELGADLDTPAVGSGSEVVTAWYDADSPTGPTIPVGGQAEFKYEVTNTGDVALSNVVVSDDRIANLAFVGGDVDNDSLLDTNETWIYSATETVQTGVQYVNIGTATGVDAASGRRATDSDAAHYTTTALTASIGDRVWLDANANGIQDTGEAGVAGVTVKLLNAAGAVLSTQATDANGNYLFNNLTPGDYAVQVITPTGYSLTGRDLGGNDHLDSDVDQSTGKTVLTSIASGEVDLSWDAGLVQAKASIGDKVWLDCDGDGIQDANEVGLGGVTVKLLNSTGGVVSTTSTDYQGNYLFSSLTPGDYAIQVVAPSGYSITAKDQGTNDALDSDIDTTGKTVTTTLVSGENDLSWDAGLTTVGACVDVSLIGGTNSGSSAGNIRTFNSNGLMANASAFSRTDSGSWATAYLASYSGGLGVTDTSEDGATPSHAVDNVGRDNYVMFEFNQLVALDKAFLGWVSGDSDIQVWIGNYNNPYGSHLTLSDSVLSGMGFSEVNTTTLTTTRWADVNAGDYVGNVIVIAADTTDTTPEDYFKIQTLSVCTPACGLNASIGDKVWLDANGNGVQDAGEAGISGVTVKLLDAAGAVVSTTTTDANGNYLFSALTPGDYAVQVMAPSGYSISAKDQGTNDAADSDFDPTTGKIITTTLSGGENDLTWDAGLHQKASIGDRVWCDTDKDGIQDTGEAGASGVTVKLLNAAGAVVATTTTNASGNYLFSALTPGDYAIQVVAPTGYSFSAKDQGTNDAVDSDVDVSTGKTVTTTLVSGENDLSWDAGLSLNKARLGDTVWEDLDYDGIQDAGEAGIANVTVKLLSSTGTLLQTKTTDASGKYFFDVDAGTYKVQVTTPTGYVATKSNQGTDDAVDSDAVSGVTGTYTVTAGQQNLTVDAGFYKKASIGDKVWYDTNANGIQDAGEAGASGVTVKLLNSAGSVQATTTTNASGVYSFANLDPGNYSIQVVAPSGYAFSAKDQGTNDATDSDVDQWTGKTVATTLVSGENDLTWDAGLVRAARIGDKVWEDMDYDGIQDAGEAGIGNVTVKLLSSTGAVLQTKTTDANGNYFFDVAAGTYKVQVVTPSGYYETKSNQGTNDAIDSDTVSGTTGTYTVTAGQQQLTVDGGLYKKASVGDKVWEDKNHNWLQDAGEPGIGGVKVTLKTSGGTTVASTTTNSSGNYNFANLNPGDYYLVFDKTTTVYNGINMSNWMWGKKDIGSNDAIDSDVTGDGVSKTNVTQTSVFNLSSGENDMTWDASITPIAIDLNGDGIQTISRANSSGTFDLLGNGSAIQSGWLSGEDGFLALDRNGNGGIDDINELFGGFSQGDGYAKLAAFDSNGDGVVDAADAAFVDLSIWKDVNGNHQTDAGELLTLAQAGVDSLSLAYQSLPLLDGNGNLHLERGSATLADGTVADMTDVYFGISAADVEAAGIELPSLADLMSDSGSLDALLGAAEATTPVDRAAAAANDAFAGSALEAMKQLADLVDQAAYA